MEIEIFHLFVLFQQDILKAKEELNKKVRVPVHLVLQS